MAPTCNWMINTVKDEITMRVNTPIGVFTSLSHRSASSHAVNNSHLLTFTIFIIQSQIGAIPVMAAILEFENLRKAGEMDKVLPRGW